MSNCRKKAWRNVNIVMKNLDFSNHSYLVHIFVSFYGLEPLRLRRKIKRLFSLVERIAVMKCVCHFWFSKTGLTSSDVTHVIWRNTYKVKPYMERSWRMIYAKPITWMYYTIYTAAYIWQINENLQNSKFCYATQTHTHT